MPVSKLISSKMQLWLIEAKKTPHKPSLDRYFGDRLIKVFEQFLPIFCPHPTTPMNLP